MHTIWFLQFHALETHFQRFEEVSILVQHFRIHYNSTDLNMFLFSDISIHGGAHVVREVAQSHHNVSGPENAAVQEAAIEKVATNHSTIIKQSSRKLYNTLQIMYRFAL